MNCEQCHELVSDLVDGVLSQKDQLSLNDHLEQCLSCADVRHDLEAIVGFCRTNRGEYDAPPNERGLWLRIRNTIETENAALGGAAHSGAAEAEGFWQRLFKNSWQVSLPQLTASVAAIVVIVALTTAVTMRQSTKAPLSPAIATGNFDLDQRYAHQQQAIRFWNARIETNRARWSPQMRDTFDRNMGVIEQAVNDSLKELNKNPHDEVSEDMLNAALNDKIALLKDFSEL
jgi:Putative zinc-finger